MLNKSSLESVALYLMNCHDYVQDLYQRKSELQVELDLLTFTVVGKSEDTSKIKMTIEETDNHIHDLLLVAQFAINSAADLSGGYEPPEEE